MCCVAGSHLVPSTSTYQVRKTMRKGSKEVDPEVQVRDVLESFQLPATSAYNIVSDITDKL